MIFEKRYGIYGSYRKGGLHLLKKNISKIRSTATTLLFITLLITIGILQGKLDEYSHGFLLKGTYQQASEKMGAGEYLCFNKEDNQLIFYQYQQLDIPMKGTVQPTRQVNLYQLVSNKAKVDKYHIVLEKGGLYLISPEESIYFEKISDEMVLINPKDDNEN